MRSSRSTCGRGNPSTELRAVLRPPAGLLAQAEPQAGRGRKVHAAAVELQALVEERLQPIEVLEPRLARVGRGEVQVDLHREMGCQLEAAQVRELHDLQEMRGSAYARD